MIKFHTYGDSHASKHGSWDRVNLDEVNIVINWLGPKTMYSFGRDKEMIIKRNEIGDNDFVCFCFGEIDCRAHINKYEPNWKENIDNLVNEYFKAIYKNISGLNVKVCVYNAVPQLERNLERYKWIKDWENMDPVNRSSRGTDEDRVRYTLYMNKKLKEYCDTYDYIFFDIYEKYVDDKGYLNPMYSDNNCHIDNPIFIIEKLKTIINEYAIKDN
jgi:hypothetical protein